jgi:beta-lactamase superfamily II metal-dependent hydrolase
MIRLSMFPAIDGDCLLLEYGQDQLSRAILIDGGRESTYLSLRPALTELSTEGRQIDLLVVTHIDQDHILGILALFEDPQPAVGLGEVWFNGYDHLKNSPLETFGARDGEMLTTELLRKRIAWNRAFAGSAVEIGRPFRALDNEATITILAPDRQLLEDLIPSWETECKKHGLIPGKDPDEMPPDGMEAFGTIDIDELADKAFERDGSLPNRTSIAFLFEYDGVRILFTGDADDPRLVKSVEALAAAEGGKLRLDALKVSHHGSRKNTSREFLALLDCDKYLISTNGAHHHHPDPVAMARVIKYGGDRKELVFNYQGRAAEWDVGAWKNKFQYSVSAPARDDGYTTIEW